MRFLTACLIAALFAASNAAAAELAATVRKSGGERVRGAEPRVRRS